MFDLLSRDIVFIILKDYLKDDWKSLSALDVAILNSKIRPYLLAIITSSSTQWSWHSSHAGTSIDFLIWLGVRNIKLSDVYLDAVKLKPLPMHVAGIETLHLRDNSNRLLPITRSFNTSGALTFSSLHRFPQTILGSDQDGTHNARVPLLSLLDRLPDLRKLVTCNEIEDSQIINIHEARCSLMSINLRQSLKLSSLAVANVCIAMGNRLEELSCSVLDDISLHMIAETCHNLRFIWLSCEAVLNYISIVAICSSNAESLRELHLHYQDDSCRSPLYSVITDSLLCSIAVNCPNLTTLVIGSKFKYNCVTSEGIRTVLQSCPLIQCIRDDVKDLMIELSSNNGSRPSCAVQCWFDAAATILLDLLPSLSLWKVVLFNISDVINPLLKHIGEYSGKTLQYFQCAFINPIDNQILDRFFANCPNLTYLDLSLGLTASCYSSMLQLPQYCQKLECLRFHQLAISDVMMMVLIDGLHRSNCPLKSLLVIACPQLTDRVLSAIHVNYPCLETLSLVDCHGVKKHVVVELLGCGKLRPERLLCDDSDWIHSQLRAMGVRLYHHHGLGQDRSLNRIKKCY